MSPLSSKLNHSLACAVDILLSSKKGVALTGAGISTPSGIPDFRSPTSGLWARYDPFEVASLSAFRYNPQAFYQWIRTLADAMLNAQPNPAHIAMAQLNQAGYIQTIITQNIDGLHQRAGAKEVLEVHGSMDTLTCVSCYKTFDARQYRQALFEDGAVPYCSSCGGTLKPDVVLFGEQLPSRTWLKANQASKDCDLMLVAGSSLEVLPVAGLPMRSLENGAHLIIINHTETYLDVRADVVFHEDVAEVLPALASEVLKGS